MLTLIERGGVILILIIALSVVAVAIIVERLLFLRRIRSDDDQLISRLKKTLSKGHFDEALAICEAGPSPVSNLIRVGIEHREYSEEIIKSMIADAANMEVPRMERFLSTLGTIAHIAPLLGLLGTVTGNIRAFGVLGDFGAAGGNPAILARGIAEALITTAAGIIVSIPAIIFYNYLLSKVNHLIIHLENRVSELVLLLKRSPKAVETLPANPVSSEA
jgi:biopolymer transport protein ExbB